jgi:oligoribonuclease
VLVVHQTEAHLATMDSWNKGTHTRSGLVDRVKASPLSESQVEQTMLDFLKAFVPAGKSPMCGNTIHQDRRFLLRYMPRLEAFFHYRNIDVSTIKELCRRWRPELLKGFTKKGAHTALADILESIEELRYYRKHLMPQTYSDSVRT